MYNKLSRKELRIIEQTKREGELLQQSEQQDGKKGRLRLAPYIIMIVVFTGVALGVKMLISLFS